REAVIEVVRINARHACSADGVCFVLREGDLCYYVEEDAIAPLWKGQRFPISACMSGWSMLSGQTAVVSGVCSAPLIAPDVYRRTFVKSLIMTPVGEDGTVAAIGAYWQDKRYFSEREIAAVKTMVRLVGRALADIL